MDRIVSYGIFSLFDRSSQDDYCPPDQVEFIQNSVLEILQDLYLEIELTVDYEWEMESTNLCFCEFMRVKINTSKYPVEFLFYY